VWVTHSAGGIFRGLRHLAVFDGLIDDMADLCPSATVCQYSNPMAILTWRASFRPASRGPLPQRPGNGRLLAGIVKCHPRSSRYCVAGSNHQAWFLRLEHQGKRPVPRLRSHLDNSETLAQEPVRFELMRRFGYFVTESSGHASEYLPLFPQASRLSASLSRPQGRIGLFFRSPTAKRAGGVRHHAT